MPCTRKRAWPSMIMNGAKAASVVSVPNTTSGAISYAPRTEAAAGSSGSRSRCAWMFSPVTIESSASTPIAMTNAKIVRMLMSMSKAGISATAPRIEIGRPSATQSAMRRRRKIASSSTTSTNPLAPLRSIIESRSSR